MEETQSIFLGTSNMISVIVLACLLVMLAMIIDLGSGLYKAKQRGEIRSSWGLKRTLSKFIMYEGGMLIAGCIDLLLYYSHLYHLFNLQHLIGIPFVTCLLGIFLLVVEYLSLREAADEKTQTELSRVEAMAAKMVTKEELVDILAEVVNRAKQKEE